MKRTNLKRMGSLCLAWVLCVSAPLMALAEDSAADALILSAVVAPKAEIALKAPASGELAAFMVQAGDAVDAGITLFTVEPKRVYADIDGTVAAVYVQAGDVADAAVARYGAALKIEYVDRYELAGNVRSGYNSTENRDLHVGMPVFLRSINEKHFADGSITSVNGNNFTVQVRGGDLVYTQDVKVYREADYDSKTLLARGALSTVTPYAVSASGTITQVAVETGTRVKAGDFLFAFVPDALEPALRGKQDATAVKAEHSLIVKAVNVSQGASVQKGQALALAYQADSYRLIAQVEEGEVGNLHVGDGMTVRFDELNLPAVQATVAAISPLGSEGNVSKYNVYLDFEAPEGVLLGMHATVGK